MEELEKKHPYRRNKMREELKNYFSEMLAKLGLSHIEGTFEEQWLSSNGLKLYTVVFPSGENKPTIVFIPGTSVYALCYAELLHNLNQAGINVLSFDPRGQGQSQAKPGDYTIMEHTKDALSLVKYARERFKGPVFVMGSSQGGIEAFYLALSYDQIDGVICHNLADLADPESIRLTRFGLKELPKGKFPKSYAYLARLLMLFTYYSSKLFPRIPVWIPFYLDLKNEPMRVFHNAWNFIKQDPLTLKFITLRAFGSLSHTPLPKPIAELKTPILVLHSSLDHIFPEDYILKIYHQITCEKEIKIYPDLPHLITIEYVPQILPDIINWIKKRHPDK